MSTGDCQRCKHAEANIRKLFNQNSQNSEIRSAVCIAKMYASQKTISRSLLRVEMMRFTKCVTALSIILLTTRLTANLPSSYQQNDQAKPAVLVVMAPQGPVLARLKISVDRKPYRTWVTSLLVSRLDLNADSLLTESELTLIPDRLLSQAQISSSKSLIAEIQADVENPSDQAKSIPVAEFRTWFSKQLQDGFNIVASQVAASDSVRLSALIDANSDGMVTAAEIQGATEQLKFRDLDDDQTFTASELLPFRDPRNQQVALVPEVANLPMIQVTDQKSAFRAAKQILKRYGNKNELAAKQLRLPENTWANTASQGVFSEQTLAKWLLSQTDRANAAAVHLTLTIRLSDRANASKLSVEVLESSQDFCNAEMFRKDSRCRLRIDEMPIEIRTRGGSKDSRGFLVGFLLQRMSAYDEDKDQSISEDEFPALQAELSNQLKVTGSFQELDLNSDGMLLREEVKGFIERDSLATQSRIEVSVRQDGRTLFKLLDTNSDRRLSPRELQTGFEALREFDDDGDERVSENELGTSYRLTIGLGQPESLRGTSMMSGGAMGSTDAVLPGLAGLRGPEWFRRMDRNQDGDVAWREFLGDRKLFDQLDTDSNQLLDPDEASQLKNRSNN